MKRAVIYARVSSKGQKDNHSLPSQEKECRAFAAEHGYRVVEVISEQADGADWTRGGPKRFLALAERGEIDAVIVHHSDRLARDRHLAPHIRTSLAHVGVSVLSVTDGALYNDDSDLEGVKKALAEWVAEMERQKIRERTQRGKRERVESGKPLVTKHPPYGYRYVRVPGKKEGTLDVVDYELDPATAPIVRDIFDRALAGEPLRRIAESLAERGIPSPRGKDRWTVNTISGILRRRIYTGTQEMYRTKHTRRGDGRYDREAADPESILTLPAPAIVNEDEAAAVRERLANNRAYAPRNNRAVRTTLLRAGHIYCWHCGRAMHAENANPKRPGSQPAYRCNSRAVDGIDCPSPRIPAPVVDAEVWDRVRMVISEPELLERAIQMKRDTGSHMEDVARLEAELAEVNAQHSRLTKYLLKATDDRTADRIVKEMDALAAREGDVEAALKSARNRLGDAEADLNDLKALRIWASKIDGRLNRLTYDEKRLALAAFGVSAVISKPEGGKGGRIERIDIAPLVPEESIAYRPIRRT
jgi:site-specific DNA recombinase